jgi:hypothetical protein
MYASMFTLNKQGLSILAGLAGFVGKFFLKRMSFADKKTASRIFVLLQ